MAFFCRRKLQHRHSWEACLRAVPLCDSPEFSWLKNALEKPWDSDVYTGRACWGSLCQGPDIDVGMDVHDDNRVDFHNHNLVSWLPPCDGSQPGAGLQLLHQPQWEHSVLVSGPPPRHATQAHMPQTNKSTVNKFENRRVSVAAHEIKPTSSTIRMPHLQSSATLRRGL